MRKNTHTFHPGDYVTWDDPNEVVGWHSLEAKAHAHGHGPFLITDARVALDPAVGHAQNIRLAEPFNRWFSGAYFKPAAMGPRAVIDYTNHRGVRSTRTITPAGLHIDQDYHKGQWCVWAYCHERKDFRLFALTSIHSWKDVT